MRVQGEQPVVAVIGSLDTKGKEHRFLAEVIRDAGATPLVVDFGIMGEPGFQPDVSAALVAHAAGTSIEELRGDRDVPGARGRAIEAMARGMARIMTDLWVSGRIDGAVGLGGGQGSTVISAGLRALPVGVPKMLVSTMTPSNVGLYFGHMDLALMYSVTDISGLNRVSRRLISNAGRAISGMVLGRQVNSQVDERPLVAITMFGTTTLGVVKVQEQLEHLGFETIVFHAVGSGGAAMEEMIEQGMVDGVVDYTPSEITDELLGGIFSSGPRRMEVAGERGIPQILVPGALCQLTMGPLASLSKQLTGPGRTYVVHNPSVTVVRVDAAGAAIVGREFARKAGKASGPVEVVLPLGGLSEYEVPGEVLGDVASDEALFSAIRDALPKDVPLYARPEDINDPEFARFVADRFVEIWTASGHKLPLAHVEAVSSEEKRNGRPTSNHRGSSCEGSSS